MPTETWWNLPADKRQRVFSISDAGRLVLRRDMRLRDEWLASVMQAELTPAERDAVLHAAAVLERLADADGTAPRPSTPSGRVELW